MFGVDDALLIGGGISLATSALNAYEQSQNRSTQVDLANTAHQREVADLKAAGLNPMLSLNHGAAVPPTQAPQIENPANSALAAMQAKSAIALTNAQTDATSAQAESTRTQTNTSMQTQEFAIQQARQNLLNSGLDSDTKRSQLKILDEQLLQIKLNNTLLRYNIPESAAKAKYYSGPGGQNFPFNPGLGTTINSAKGVIDALRLNPPKAGGPGGGFYPY